MFWFESVCQWLTDYCLAIPTILGSTKAQSRPIIEPGQTPPLLNTAWTGNQLQMQPLEEGECFRCSTANQKQASLASLPACTMNLFLGPRAGGGARIGGGGLFGSMNKVGYRSVILADQRHTVQESPYTDIRQFIITMATRINFAFFWKRTHVLHL